MDIFDFPPPPPPPPKFFDNPTLRMKTNYENISKELGKIKASFQSYPIFEFENVFCSNLLLLPPPPPPSPPHAPYYVRKAFKSPYWGFGTGKGARKPKTKIPISNNYFSFLKNNPHLAKSFIGMSMEDFDNLYQQTAAKIEEPRAYYNKNNPIRKHATNLSTSSLSFVGFINTNRLLHLCSCLAYPLPPSASKFDIYMIRNSIILF